MSGKMHPEKKKMDSKVAKELNIMSYAFNFKNWESIINPKKAQ